MKSLWHYFRMVLLVLADLKKIIFEVFLEFLLWPLQSERAYILLAGLAITQIQEWSADTT